MTYFMHKPGYIDETAVLRHLRLAPSYLIYPPAARFVRCGRPATGRSGASLNRRNNPTGELAIQLCLPQLPNHELRAGAVALLCRDIVRWQPYLDADYKALEIHWTGDIASYGADQLALIESTVCRTFPGAANALKRVTVKLFQHACRAEKYFDLLKPHRIDLAPAEGALGLHWVRLQRQHAELLCRAKPKGTSVGMTLLFGDHRVAQADFEYLVDDLVGRRPDHVMLIDVSEHAQAHCALVGQRAFASRRNALDTYVYAARSLAREGYHLVARNHYALPDSALTRARVLGMLGVQPDGITTRPTSVRLSMGPGAIGCIGATYYQNPIYPGSSRTARTHPSYFLGWQLSKIDLARRAVIHRLATDFMVDLAAVEIAYGIDADRVFALELRRLEEAERAGLLQIRDRTLILTPTGERAAGAMCMVFDEYIGAHAPVRRRWPKRPLR